MDHSKNSIDWQQVSVRLLSNEPALMILGFFSLMILANSKQIIREYPGFGLY